MVLVKQRGERDCGVGAIAMLAGIPYEDAYLETAKVDPIARGKGGLTNAEVVQVARRLRIRLRPTRKFDLDADEGILRIRFNCRRRAKDVPGGHFVTVRESFILCPSDHSALPWRDYLDRWNARPCTLLQEWG